MRDGDRVESESEDFLRIHGTFRTEISEATRRVAEEEFLRTKRELLVFHQYTNRTKSNRKLSGSANGRYGRSKGGSKCCRKKR